jgi:chemotaxis protein histidine kinase CheA
MATDLSEFKQLYNQTANEYLQKLQNGIVAVKANPTDHDVMKVMHLSAHSLKSQSLVMGYTSIGHLCALLEKTFASVLDQTLTFSDEIISTTEQAITELAVSLKRVTDEGVESDLTQPYEKLSQVTGLKVT